MQNDELIPLYQKKCCADKADSEKRGLLHYGTESEMLLMKPEISDIWEDMEKDWYEKCQLKAIRLSIEDLAELRPEWHSVFVDYYFTENAKKTDIAKKHGISRQNFERKLNKALRLVKRLSYKYLDEVLHDPAS